MVTLGESLIRKEDIGPQNACKEEGEPRQRSVDTAFCLFPCPEYQCLQQAQRQAWSISSGTQACSISAVSLSSRMPWAGYFTSQSLSSPAAKWG